MDSSNTLKNLRKSRCTIKYTRFDFVGESRGLDVGLGCGRKKGKENPLTMVDNRQHRRGEEEEIHGALQTTTTEEKKRLTSSLREELDIGLGCGRK